MKISINQFFTKPGYSYPFTGFFIGWVQSVIAKRIRPSDAFIRTYGKDYGLCFFVDAKPDITKPDVYGPRRYSRDKEVQFTVNLPHPGGPESKKSKDNLEAMKLYLEGIVIALERVEITSTKISADMSTITRDFLTRPQMIAPEGSDYWLDSDTEDLQESRAPEAKPAVPRKSASKKENKKRKLTVPEWRIPRNVSRLVEDEGGTWEDERFDPILLTVMSGITYRGREIPLSWQIEFDPYDERFAGASQQIEALGIDPDGDGWADVIQGRFARRYPRLAAELHSDSETSTCVLWVESESACKKLIELVWSLIYPK